MRKGVENLATAELAQAILSDGDIADTVTKNNKKKRGQCSRGQKVKRSRRQFL